MTRKKTHSVKGKATVVKMYHFYLIKTVTSYTEVMTEKIRLTSRKIRRTLSHNLLKGLSAAVVVVVVVVGFNVISRCLMLNCVCIQPTTGHVSDNWK